VYFRRRRRRSKVVVRPIFIFRAYVTRVGELRIGFETLLIFICNINDRPAAGALFVYPSTGIDAWLPCFVTPPSFGQQTPFFPHRRRDIRKYLYNLSRTLGASDLITTLRPAFRATMIQTRRFRYA